MPKQGDKLDVAFGLQKAWWVIYPRIFLFLPPPDQQYSELKLSDGSICFGFNANNIAAHSGGDATLLLLNNQIGSLSAREEPGEITKGANRAINVIFSLHPNGDFLCAPVKVGKIRGTA